MANMDWFVDARFGLFVHYGLYSMLGRGEWVMNREAIPREEYKALANRFTAEHFDADVLCDLAVDAGMKYIIFTTMHHDGFRLYDTGLTDFCTTRTASRRDLVWEVVNAARSRNLKVCLYHSLNNWMDLPDGVDALESDAGYQRFMDNTHARVRELVTKFNPIDVLWYDGWWPFNEKGWKSEEMNRMVREIQPHILFNGRNGLPGDFSTPEGHLSAPKPWRPWEACITHNNNWAFHVGDQDFKSAGQIVDMLATCANGRGNLALNIGPRGDGSLPSQSVAALKAVGGWLRRCGECVTNTDIFTFDLQEKGSHRAEWNNAGPFTVSGNNLYMLVRRWVGETLTVAGLDARVTRVVLLGRNKELTFTQADGRVIVKGLPAEPPDEVCPVIRFECDRAPSLYLTGGLRVPNVPHPHYDPCPSDLQH